MYLFVFLTMYMFRAHRAHHQERQIVSIQPLVAVGGRVVCRSEVHFLMMILIVLYSIVPYQLANIYRPFEGACSLHL